MPSPIKGNRRVVDLGARLAETEKVFLIIAGSTWVSCAIWSSARPRTGRSPVSLITAPGAAKASFLKAVHGVSGDDRALGRQRKVSDTAIRIPPGRSRSRLHRRDLRFPRATCASRSRRSPSSRPTRMERRSCTESFGIGSGNRARPRSSISTAAAEASRSRSGNLRGGGPASSPIPRHQRREGQRGVERPLSREILRGPGRDLAASLVAMGAQAAIVDPPARAP